MRLDRVEQLGGIIVLFMLIALIIYRLMEISGWITYWLL